MANKGGGERSRGIKCYAVQSRQDFKAEVRGDTVKPEHLCLY